MLLILALVIGVLYGSGIYMILRRSLVKVLFGLLLLSHAVNLLIFTVGRITKGRPAFIEGPNNIITEPFADPVPQALILTAIVIGFGVVAFAIVLFRKTYAATNSDDIDKLNTTDNFEQ
jgi:multicomponent Na+:H+ antiporter subunit C